MFVEWYDRDERKWCLSYISLIKGIIAWLSGAMAWEKTEENFSEYDFFRVPKSKIDFN